MKLQFDANQQFQLDAVAAVVDLFDGQPLEKPEYTVINVGSYGGFFAGQEQTELGVGNRLLLDAEKLRENTRAVQERNDIEFADAAVPLASWDHFDQPADQARTIPHFSVEMETGTGKTYVYLRTIFELSQRYGFQKFIIVVPSVAIREGVLKNIEITANHFRALYNNLPFEHFVYDAKKVNRLRRFATSNTLQILVINIDSFNKNFGDSASGTRSISNVIFKESDKLSGRQPIEFVQAARPIVIIDEPQSVDSTDRAQEAIRALNPLCTLRYSATHRNPYNVIYRLDPVRAFELKLVKQIVVASAVAEGTANDAYVRLLEVDNRKGIKAKLRIHQQTATGPKEKTVTVKYGHDLFTLSNEREQYQDGFTVSGINTEPGNEHVTFNSGRSLRLGEEWGGVREDIWRVQIKETIKRHLDKELQVQVRGIKVLSLFFIDRVANYRDYDGDGQPTSGKFAQAFEAELQSLSQDQRYASLEWLKLPIATLHDGYFAQDKKGALKDTRGDTQADDEVYNLIMKDKERLLSLETPLRFIFSHSALREGWDNPNVFQICTLNESQSAIKKRQEIGRGLRLPVDQHGMRVFDESINRLYVMANESYEEFAKALQTEYEEEGLTFGRVPLSAFAKLTRVENEQEIPIGRSVATTIREHLVQQGILDNEGRILPAFTPQEPGFRLDLPGAQSDLAPSVIDLLTSYQIERHIQRARNQTPNPLKQQALLTPEFRALWDRIKAKTTYRVEFDTEELVQRAVAEIKRMPRIEQPRIYTSAGLVQVGKRGITTSAVSVAEEKIDYGSRAVPDLLAYLQNETELTRATLTRILIGSGRLDEFFNNPQRFLDEIAKILKHELHRLLVDGIKYERLESSEAITEWEMSLFEPQEVIDQLSAISVKNSIYEYIVYDSEIEREFARQLDEREDIKLFVKLPSKFIIETPVGGYNPDWAIVKQNGRVLYLIRETKSTHNFLKLRTSEADKVRCGKAHFEALDVPFEVVVTAQEV